MDTLQRLQELVNDAIMYYQAGMDDEADSCLDDIESAIEQLREEM